MSDTLLHLFLIVACEYSKYYWCIMSNGKIHNSTRRFTADIVKMWSLTTNDNTNCDNKIISSFLDEFPCKCRNFECTRYKVRLNIMKPMRHEKCSILSLELTCIFQIELSDNESNTNIPIKRIDILETSFIIRHRKNC